MWAVQSSALRWQGFNIRCVVLPAICVCSAVCRAVCLCVFVPVWPCGLHSTRWEALPGPLLTSTLHFKPAEGAVALLSHLHAVIAKHVPSALAVGPTQWRLAVQKMLAGEVWHLWQSCMLFSFVVWPPRECVLVTAFCGCLCSDLKVVCVCGP